MTKEFPIVHSERIIKDLLLNKYFLNKASKDSNKILKDDSFANVAAGTSLLIHFISRLDDKPVKAQDEISLAGKDLINQRQSLIGPAEEIYIDRGQAALKAAINFRDRFM